MIFLSRNRSGSEKWLEACREDKAALGRPAEPLRAALGSSYLSGRSGWHELSSAHLKRILRLGRLRLRCPSGAQDEFTLAAIAQNLRRLAKFVVRPLPPAEAYLA